MLCRDRSRDRHGRRRSRSRGRARDEAKDKFAGSYTEGMTQAAESDDEVLDIELHDDEEASARSSQLHRVSNRVGQVPKQCEHVCDELRLVTMFTLYFH